MGEKEVKEQKKLSYDELSNVAVQLQQQNKFLLEQLQKQQGESFYKRLDYLFEVVKLKDVFQEKFINSCIDEIVGTITIQEEVKQPDTQEIK
jgi:hypothetical protein